MRLNYVNIVRSESVSGDRCGYYLSIIEHLDRFLLRKSFWSSFNCNTINLEYTSLKIDVLVKLSNIINAVHSS